MSQSAAFDFSKFVPGFDFLQKLASGNNSASPSASSWVAPTLDPQEIERRIKDLRAAIQMARGTGKRHTSTQLVNEHSFVN